MQFRRFCIPEINVSLICDIMDPTTRRKFSFIADAGAVQAMEFLAIVGAAPQPLIYRRIETSDVDGRATSWSKYETDQFGMLGGKTNASVGMPTARLPIKSRPIRASRRQHPEVLDASGCMGD